MTRFSLNGLNLREQVLAATSAAANAAIATANALRAELSDLTTSAANSASAALASRLGAEQAEQNAVDISNIDVPDDVVELLIKPGAAGPKTKVALSAFSAAVSDLYVRRDTAPGLASAGSRPVRVGARARLIAGSAQHNAFPGLAACHDGTLLTVWRQAADHNPSATGIIRAIKQAPGGLVIAPTETVLTDALDLRDPMLTVLNDGRIVMQYFKHDGTANTVAGVFLAISEDHGASFTEVGRVPFTWDALAASSGRMVVAPNGDWLVAAYGRTSATFQHIRLMRSADEGQTWTGEVTVAEGQAESRNYVEPVIGLLPDGQTLMCLIRVSDSNGANPAIYRTTSTDNGLTWAPEASVLTASGGRPAWTALSSGAIVATYRSTVAPFPMLVRTSRDNGVTWTPATQLGLTPSNQGAYAQPVEIAPGLVAVAYSIEASTASAVLSLGYLADGWGWSPLEDDFTLPASAYPADYAIVDTFARADSATLGFSETGQEWTTRLGGIGITSNLAQTVTGSGTSIATVDTGLVDGDFSVGMRWAAGGLSGNGLIVRWVDSSNYLFATIESAGGALRLKKVAGGSISNLAEVTGLSNASEVWHTLRITMRANVIHVYLNGTLRITHTLSAADRFVYGQGTQAGLRATLDGHRFGNLVVKRSFLDLPTLA